MGGPEFESPEAIYLAWVSVIQRCCGKIGGGDGRTLRKHRPAALQYAAEKQQSEPVSKQKTKTKA